MSSPAPVHIRDESIRLGQLLKLAGLVEDGLVEPVAGGYALPG